MQIREKQYENSRWIDIEAPSEQELSNIKTKNNVHSNIVEDALEKGHLPKIERTEGNVFLILRAYHLDASKDLVDVEEISKKVAFFYSQEELITTHPIDFSFLDVLKNKHLQNIEELALEIIHQIILSFEEPVQEQSDKVDFSEQQLFLNDENSISLKSLYYEKARARIIRKLIQLNLHVINQLTVEEAFQSNLQDIKESASDLLLRADEVIEDVNNLLNFFMSVQSRKNNEVMKLLTIFSVFFLPITFIAGLYGMNFDFMPEIHWHYGYYFILLLMLIIEIVIFFWFKRKKLL